MTNITNLTSFLLFHVILELLIIFMVMIIIVKTELINAAENCRANILFVKNFVYQQNNAFPTPILIWSRPKG